MEKVTLKRTKREYLTLKGNYSILPEEKDYFKEELLSTIHFKLILCGSISESFIEAKKIIVWFE